MSKSKFNINGIVMTEWVSEDQTVNQTYYLTALATLREWVRKKWSELWKNKSWILHQDGAPAHNMPSVKSYLATTGTPVLKYAPYSPDSATYDFFQRSSLPWKEPVWVNRDERKSAELLNALTTEDFQHCFDQWKNWRGGDWGQTFWVCHIYKINSCSIYFLIFFIWAWSVQISKNYFIGRPCIFASKISLNYSVWHNTSSSTDMKFLY